MPVRWHHNVELWALVCVGTRLPKLALAIPKTKRRLLRFLRNDYRRLSFAGSFDCDGEFSVPTNVAVSPSGVVLVTDKNTHRVVVLRLGTDGHTLTHAGSFGSEGSGDGKFNLPQGVAVAPSGVVLVADSNNNRVVVLRLGADGKTLTHASSFGSRGSGDGEFNYPSAVAVARSGTILVADGQNHRVVVLRLGTDGHTLTHAGSFGSKGSGEGEFRYPCGVAVAPSGAILVADTCNRRVVVLRLGADGHTLTHVGSFGSKGSGDGKFNQLYGVAVAPSGVVLVADMLNNRIVALSPS